MHNNSFKNVVLKTGLTLWSCQHPSFNRSLHESVDVVKSIVMIAYNKIKVYLKKKAKVPTEPTCLVIVAKMVAFLFIFFDGWMDG